MSLQVWLPLNGGLQNRGIKKYNISTLGTISWPATGKIGKCFQGGAGTQVSNGISLDSNLTNILNADYSIAVWVKPLGSHVHYNGTIISSGDWNRKRWAFGVNQDNTKVDVLSNGHNVYLNCSVPVNTWTHLVCIRQNGVIKLYKNGIYVDSLSTSAASANLESDATNTTIGRQTYANGYFSFNGCINDLRIYNNALSQQQIKQIAKGLILHYPLNRSNYGEPNLITKSMLSSAPWAAAITGTEFYKGKNAIIVRNNILYTKTSKGTTSIFPNITFEEDTQYTLSLDWCDHMRTDGKNCSMILRFKYDDGTVSSITSPKSGTDANWTHVVLTSTAGKNISMMTTTYGNAGYVSIANLKLEKGNQETNYSPAIDEINNIQYDVSGYQNNGIKNNITYDSDTSKYEVSSVFTSANTSYVKVSENNWIPQYQQAMTINLWVYSANWASTTKLFSCTESGGWNTESGSSGYIRFPVYVATNSGRTSHGYKYSSKELKISDMTAGWHMLTFIYDSTGNKVYVDGQLHSSYAYTSYGIKYNTNARLFLGCEASTASPASPYLNGKMSDFRIYVTALSAEDILSLYNNEAEIDQSGIIHGQIR